MSVNSTDPMIGRLIDGRYQVRSRIARGGMATVYLATDLRLERRVAIKIMHGHLADDSQFKERFIQEARSAARLAHPNVVNVFDQGQDSDMAYLVMEYLPGITLRDLLTEHKTLTSEQTLDILEAVLSGLAAAHKSGIVHRDLKPENVLLADDGRIKIGDFGLARAASANTATGAALLGTIAYLSPELVTRGIADTRSDIYAVGIMMYEMLAGEQPFKGEQPMQIAYQHANDSVPTPSTKNPRVPAELDELVLWATAREPDQRPRDARAMLDQLLETQHQLMSALPTGSTAAQRTTVLPAAVNRADAAETQVLRARQPAAVATVETGSNATVALAETTGKRRAKGWWLLGLVILLAGLAGGTGWYFGAGPGSTVTIPDSIIGQTPETATAIIEELGLTVNPELGQTFDPVVEEGRIAAADPAVDEAVARDTVVTLLVSQGPKPVAVPEFVGLTEEAALELAGTSGFVAQESETQFADAEPGIVLAAFGEDAAGTRIPLVTGEEYYDQRPVTFAVSLGPLPAISGLTVAEATAALAAVEVTATEGDLAFSDTVAEGLVIGAYPTTADAPIRQGDSVLLSISRGPETIEVPDVVGDRIASAVAELQALGFVVEVRTEIPQDQWDEGFARVTSTEPGGQSQAPPGSTIVIRSFV